MALKKNKRTLMGNWICCWCEDEIPSLKGVNNGGFFVKERFCSSYCQTEWNKNFG